MRKTYGVDLIPKRAFTVTPGRLKTESTSRAAAEHIAGHVTTNGFAMLNGVGDWRTRMAEDGRPAERGHCLLNLALAAIAFVAEVALRPSRWRQAWRETAAAAPDDVMAVADAVAEDDTVEIQRAQPWTPGRQWRASDAWLTGAVRDFDWKAAEADATGKAKS